MHTGRAGATGRRGRRLRSDLFTKIRGTANGGRFVTIHGASISAVSPTSHVLLFPESLVGFRSPVNLCNMAFPGLIEFGILRLVNVPGLSTRSSSNYRKRPQSCGDLFFSKPGTYSALQQMFVNFCEVAENLGAGGRRFESVHPDQTSLDMRATYALCFKLFHFACTCFVPVGVPVRRLEGNRDGKNLPA